MTIGQSLFAVLKLAIKGFDDHGTDHRQLLRREYGRQVPELGFDLCGIGHGIRDLLTKELTIPLTKPVNSDLESTLPASSS